MLKTVFVNKLFTCYTSSYVVVKFMKIIRYIWDELILSSILLDSDTFYKLCTEHNAHIFLFYSLSRW